MAEFMMRHKAKLAGLSDFIETDSAGTSGWHDGKDMHCGTADMLDLHKIGSTGFVSRKADVADWEHFDYIVAMDHQNLRDLQALFGKKSDKLFGIAELVPELQYDHIPDPWYTHNFQETYQLLDVCCDALLAKIRREHKL
ncbi:low molecular weight phosphotyrosine protein phosphatase [Actinobacillus succinogenes]|nr:low molecular weight phosphotyrosine protein phosphatase [Actinobacillus succinogenes]